ncbi:hypothetical protein RSAG8_02227, partial [Rhizoctonia solani AG-8 WAC10335]
MMEELHRDRLHLAEYAYLQSFEFCQVVVDTNTDVKRNEKSGPVIVSLVLAAPSRAHASI